MNILLTNDDGIHAPGLWAMAEALKTVGDVTVVAPDREQSGVGASISLSKALRMHRLPFSMDEIPTYTVEGTPGDAVILGLAHAMRDSPADLVVSGVNAGHNTGPECFLSGTVGAAWHARMRGIPAFAVSAFSLEGPNFEIGARFAAVLADLVHRGLVPGDLLYNVNTPKCAVHEVRGVQLTRPALRTFADEVREEQDGLGKALYHLIYKRENQKLGRGTDFWAVRRHFIAVTLLNHRLSPVPRSAVPADFCELLFSRYVGGEWPDAPRPDRPVEPTRETLKVE